MATTLFVIESSRSLTVGDLLQSDLFECSSVSAKNGSLRPTADSKISDFQSVQFGVKEKSSLGFRLSYTDSHYQLSVPDLATATDWTGALMFVKSLLLILDVNQCDCDGVAYNIETVLTYRFQPKFLTALSDLTTELKQKPIVQVTGVRRPIYLDGNFLGQILQVPDDQLLDSYDKRLMLTQHINAYFSEQQVFKVEQEGEDVIIPVNYINTDCLTVLPAQPELKPEYQQQYVGVKQAMPRLFIMDNQGNKLAEVLYKDVLNSLSDGIFMLDAKYLVLEPRKSS